MNMNKLNEHTDKAIDKLRFFTIKKDMKMVNFCAGSVVTIHYEPVLALYHLNKPLSLSPTHHLSAKLIYVT